MITRTLLFASDSKKTDTPTIQPSINYRRLLFYGDFYAAAVDQCEIFQIDQPVLIQVRAVAEVGFAAVYVEPVT